MKQRKDNGDFVQNIPVHPAHIPFETDERGVVTLAVENKGAWNRLAQWLWHKPRVSYVHLDEHGSFVWRCIDGNKTVQALGEEVDARFGQAAQPLYDRLIRFFRILDSYGLVEWRR